MSKALAKLLGVTASSVKEMNVPKANAILSSTPEIKMPNTPKRTIQGPLPSEIPSNPKDTYYGSYEEAVMNSSSRYTDPNTGNAMQIRNYGTESAPLGRSRAVASRKAEGAKQNEVRYARGQASDGGGDTFYQGAEVGTDAHHRASLAGNDWMYEGLDEAGRAELAQLLRELGVITGNSKLNRNDMPQLEHKELHKWMRENGIEFAGRDVAKKINNFVNMSPQERMEIIRTWIEFGQGIQDEKSYELMSKRKKKK